MKRKLIIIGVVANASGEILLTQRYDPVFEQAHLKWDLPGGRHEIGETLEQTVAREVLEETGYKVSVQAMIPYHLEHTWHADVWDLEVVILGFYCQLKSGHPHLNDPKINAIEWVPAARLQDFDCLIGTPEFVAAAKAEGFIS